MAPLLEIRNLSKSFRSGLLGRRKEVRVLEEVSLTVEPGETVGLVGESGCGKTTLARCILRLLEPSTGSIFFDGCDLLRLPLPSLRRKRREFQMVFQDAQGSLNPRMTVKRILEEPFDAQGLGGEGERERRITELLGAVGLEKELLDRRPPQLSGGQRQRVVIARALVLEPSLIVADEPVSALDASVQAQILNLLAGIQERFGLSLLLISHSLPVVHYLATRVAVMYFGRIVEEAPADRFFSRPLHPYSQALIRSLPAGDGFKLTGQLLSGPGGEVPSPSAPPSGCAYHPRCPEAAARCRVEKPVLVYQGESRVACFLYTDEGAGRINVITS